MTLSLRTWTRKIFQTISSYSLIFLMKQHDVSWVGGQSTRIGTSNSMLGCYKDRLRGCTEREWGEDAMVSAVTCTRGSQVTWTRRREPARRLHYPRSIHADSFSHNLTKQIPTGMEVAPRYSLLLTLFTLLLLLNTVFTVFIVYTIQTTFHYFNSTMDA